MGEVSSVFVTVLGMATTFFGLICIILLAKIMSFCCRITNKVESGSKEAANVTPTAPAPAVQANNQSENKGELVAAISAAIAEDMGTDVSAIRILSIKKI